MIHAALAALVLSFGAEYKNPLEIIGDGTPGSTVTINVNLEADAPCWLGISVNQGQQTFGALNIDLGNPLIIMDMGLTDATGFATKTLTIPANIPSNPFSGLIYYAQATTFSQGDWDTSPVRDFQFATF